MIYHQMIADLEKCVLSMTRYEKGWIERMASFWQSATFSVSEKKWIRSMHNKYRNQILFFKKYGKK